MDDVAAIAAASLVLPHWNIRPTEIRVFSRSENVVLRVECDDARVVAVRLHRPGYHSLAELRSEQVWTSALQAAGIGVPRARPATAGEYYVEVTIPRSGEIRQAGVVDWIEGGQAADILASAPLATALDHAGRLGALTGRINRHALNWAPPAGFVRHHLDAEGLMGESPFWGPFWNVPELDGRARKRMEWLRGELYARLDAFGRDNGAYSMIHADLHAHNVLVDGDVVHVIDFDDAGFGWHAYELAVALGGLPAREGRKQLETAYIDAYRAENPVDEATFDMVPLLRLVRLLASIGWLHARPEHGRSNLGKMIEGAFAAADDLGLG